AGDEPGGLGGLLGGSGGARRQIAQLGADLPAVDPGQDGAEDRDPEDAADLPHRVVDGGPGAGAVGGQDGHDGLGGGGDGGAHAEPLEDEEDPEQAKAA